MNTDTSSTLMHQPAREIAPGKYFTQQNGGNQKWQELDHPQLIERLETDPPAFRTVLAITSEDDEGKPETLQGSFYTDFDGDLEETCEKFREFLSKLAALGVSLDQIRMYASGGRGFHVEIPQACFMPEPAPAEQLHRIYKEMAMSLFVDTLDLRVYSCKRMWRTPNVQRENGLCKVPLTPSEALEITPETYAGLCSQPRPHPELAPAQLVPELALLFSQARAKVIQSQGARKRATAAARNFKRIEALSLPTLDELLAGKVRFRDSAGWNQISVQVALLALSLGWSEAEMLQRTAGLVAGYTGDSSRYASAQKRTQELATQYRYLDDNPAYAPSIPALVALLDGPADDLRAAQTLLELPALDDVPEAEAQTEDTGEVQPDLFPLPYPGVMYETVVSALQAATKQQPELTTLAVLVGMASAIPGTYHLPDGLRLNLYGFGVAETGAGKDLPLRAASALAFEAGAASCGLPASGEGLEDALPDGGGMLVSVDEVAHLLAAVNGSKAPPHLVSLAGNLLRLFSASQGNYRTRAKARAKGNEARTLENPCLSLIGFSTPAALGKALSSANVADGLLGRFLMARGRTNVVPQWAIDAFAIPTEATSMARRIQAAGTIRQTIRYEPDAEARLRLLLVELSAKGDDAEQPHAKALFARSFEKLKRVAGVLAVWDCPEEPAISLAHVCWAERLVETSDAALLEFIGEELHDGATQADAARVLRVIRDLLARDPAALSKADARFAERRGVSRNAALRRSKLDARTFAQAVEHLEALGDVVEVAEAVEGGKGANAIVRGLLLT